MGEAYYERASTAGRLICALTSGEVAARLRADPARSAVLLDVDGTLAPIALDPAAAAVPERTRRLVAALAGAFGLTACVSGRRALDARRMVGASAAVYVGNHGAERLAPGAARAEPAAGLLEAAATVRAFDEGLDRERLAGDGVRVEDKEAILALHWRGAGDEARARAALEALAAGAEAQGLRTHWGRKVLEVRPALAFDKGAGVTSLLRDSPAIEAALYVGDDATDLDAFRALDELVASGELTWVARAGVRSLEGPAAIVERADLVVEGPRGAAALLELLAGAN